MQNVNNSDALNECRSDKYFDSTGSQILHKSRELGARWRELCARFLTVVDEISSWCYSRRINSDDPEQGWKLHISATILTAGDVLEKVAPFLISRDILFKAPKSLQLLVKLNSGLFHGYSQIGKFITVYPRNTIEAMQLADRLHKLTAGISAPAVPFDLRYRPQSCIYYRYGAFRYQEIKTSDGDQFPAIRDLSGNLVPDLREQAIPSWLKDPFQMPKQPEINTDDNHENPLKTTYHIFRAISQRGKGGVYQAIDSGTNPPRLCIVKEGRRLGEIGWDGCDGFRLVKYEAEVLSAIQATKINTPNLYSTFELEQNYYLVTEFVEGSSLDELLKIRRRRFSVKQVVKYAIQIAELLTHIHSAGWVWRDCKPGNLIETKDGSLRPLDFEGACRVNQSSVLTWRTLEFSAPENKEFSSHPAIEAEDIYSFGTVIYFLLTGKVYQPDSPLQIKKLRRGVPRPLEQIIEASLVLPVQKNLPSAKSLSSRLRKLLKPD